MELDEITTTAELNAIILSERRGVVLDFWGTWCQPCRSLRPHLEQLADDHVDQWRMVAVHVENSPTLVDGFDVGATPTLVYLRDGDEVARTTGAAPVSTIAGVLSDHAS